MDISKEVDSIRKLVGLMPDKHECWRGGIIAYTSPFSGLEFCYNHGSRISRGLKKSRRRSSV